MNASSLVVAAVLLSTSALAAGPRVAVMPLQAGEGVTEQMSSSITDALTAELRKVNAAHIVTANDLAAVMGVERQKELLGCAAQSCIAELAGALDVEQVVNGTLSKVGQSWLLQVNRIDAKKGATIGHASRRKKGGTVDDVLDELPAVAKELFAGMPQIAAAPEPTRTAPPQPATAAPHATGSTAGADSTSSQAAGGLVVPAGERKAPPPPTADLPPSKPVAREKLVVLTDGKGRYIAVVPFAREGESFFAGDQKALYAQRVFGSGAEGDKAFSMNFWEPRARVPAEASFDYREGKYTLTCGQKEIPLQKLADAQAKKFLASARLYDVKWRRYAYALARDDEGNYVYVDQLREPSNNTDFHLYVGEQGRVEGHVAEVLAHDQGGDVFRAGGSKLKINVHKKEGEWIVGAQRTRLTVLPVEAHADFIYSRLGAYKESLGTPCDGHF